MKFKDKVVVIGLDGADFSLIRPWLEDGTLPNIRKVFKNGISGPLKSCFPPASSPAWKCFSKGQNPGKLDVYSFRKSSCDSYTPYIVNSRSFPDEEIWDFIGKHGYKSGVLFMISTYPPKAVNGFMVTGILTPSERSDFSYPKKLKKSIKWQILRLSLRQTTLGAAENFLMHILRIFEIKQKF
ncbi:alkaline phosphatase family protein [Acidobacteriota bacterium]